MLRKQGRVLNTHAVRAHLGLSKSHIKALDRVAAQIDVNRTTVHFFVFNDGQYAVNYSDNPILCFQREMHFGVNVIHPLEQHSDPRIAMKVSAPWSALTGNAPDTGHVVYAVRLETPDRMAAELHYGGIVEPATWRVDEARKRQEGAFDIAIGGRVPVYIGKTSRGMAIRLRQHINSAVRGASTPFHRRIAGDLNYAPMIPSVTMIDSASTEEGAYDREEAHIRESIEHSDGLYVLNVTTAREAIAKLREEFPELFQRANKEQAEELVALRSKNSSAAWDDPDYAEAVICNNDRNFDAHEIRQIRMLRRLASTPESIAKSFSVEPRRIHGVLRGKTYKRIC